jgi:PIN domain nuclease of toxin-antitoxin system
VIHLDTHTAVYLAGGCGGEIPAAARAELESDDVAISPMAMLEIGYLFEIGRMSEPASSVQAALGAGLGVTVSAAPFAAVVQHALHVDWTRDPFDRLIVANALADGARLVTADRRIREHVPDVALWD